VALTLSLVLNLCFIAGAAWIHIHGPSSLPMTPGGADFSGSERKLALDPQQQQAFDRYNRRRPHPYAAHAAMRSTR